LLLACVDFVVPGWRRAGVIGQVSEHKILYSNAQVCVTHSFIFYSVSSSTVLYLHSKPRILTCAMLMFLLCMLCRLLLQLIQCMIPSLTISGYSFLAIASQLRLPMSLPFLLLLQLVLLMPLVILSKIITVAIVLFQGPNTRVRERPRGHGWSGNNRSSGSSRIP